MCALSCNVFGWGQTWPRCKRCFLAYIFLHSNASHRPYQSVTHIKAFSLHSGRSWHWIYDVLNSLTSTSISAWQSAWCEHGKVCFKTILNWYVLHSFCWQMWKVHEEVLVGSVSLKEIQEYALISDIYLLSGAPASFWYLCSHNLKIIFVFLADLNLMVMVHHIILLMANIKN